ncbi:MAG: hypothetical protein KDH96_06855 [Candidatus Riesia sp.]|nr:hypothetical protein [Candidatus Riesia sp.]
MECRLNFTDKLFKDIKCNRRHLYNKILNIHDYLDTQLQINDVDKEKCYSELSVFIDYAYELDEYYDFIIEKYNKLLRRFRREVSLCTSAEYPKMKNITNIFNICDSIVFTANKYYRKSSYINQQTNRCNNKICNKYKIVKI